ncbi:MAG: PQQ-binding-like beta-propeller repeat protein [Thermoplasmatales archaeon]|nr:PQQ-binding-like beta-propeller repeat protein [Thermoplasmatales archaeon]
MKHIIPILVILLLLSSGFVGVSNTADDLSVDAEEMDDLAFYYYDGYDSSKSEYYKEYFQRDSSEIADLEEITIPVESPQTIVSSGPMDSAWPMKCHDTHHTSRSPYSTADITSAEKWRYMTNSWIEDTPVIDSNGIIYVGSFDGYIHAVYPNGTMKWKYKAGQFGGILGSSPAINEDGIIYVGSWDDYLHAINPNGTRKWKFCVHDNIASSPAIAEDGTIYFGTMGNKVYAVNPDGTEKWHYDTGSWITSDPAIGNDGTIYIGSTDDYLYALYPNGTLRWRFKTGMYVKGPPSIAEDETIYIGSWDGYLYALYPNGTMKWRCSLGGYGTETNPSIASDGTIYAGGNALYAVYPNGTLKWVFNLGSERHIDQSSPTISADGTIYIGTNIGETSGGEIIAVNSDGIERWRKRIANKWVESSPSIGEDETVYIGASYDMGVGYLYAFEPDDSNQPPSTPNIDGQIIGKAGIGYKYTFSASDPNGNPVSLYIDWGDGSMEEWIGPYFSGQEIELSHTWSEQGNYTIRAKAKDTLGEESDWAYLEVTMPMNQQINNGWWFLQFLQNHPRMFPMLRHFLEL